MHSRRSQAPTHSASCRRSHAAYWLGAATSAASSLRDSVQATLPQLLRSDCLHALPPLDSPLANPITRYSPARSHPGPQHASSSAHCRRSQAPAHSAAAADARSVPLRFSVVSCAILPRLGASDAAPSSPIQLPARPATPRLADRKPHHPTSPTTRYSPAPNRLSPQHATSSPHCRRSQAPTHSARRQLPPMHAAYR
jgi:hypothetical protein